VSINKTQTTTSLLFLGILALSAVLYWPGLHGPLLFDDFINLDPLKQLNSSPELFFELATSNTSGPLGRPVTMMTFAFNQLTSPNNIWALKYTNLMIHLLCGCLIFWLSGRILVEFNIKNRWYAALLVATLWLVAPLFVSTVLYVVQRMAQLATLFSLAGLLCYVIGRQNTNKSIKVATSLIVCTFLIWFPLAVFSKENGALLPLLVLIVEFTLFRFQGPTAFIRLLKTIFCLFVGVPFLISLYIVIFHPDAIIGGYNSRPFSLTERLLTESRILLDYLLNMIAPQSSGFGIYHDDYTVSKNLFNPISTFISVVIWLGICGSIIYCWKKQHKKTLFFPLFFIGAHLLESTVFPLELYFEHRNYLPSFAIYLAISVILFSVITIENIKKAQKGIIALCLILPAIHAWSTYNRVLIWQSLPMLLSYSATKHPNSIRTHQKVALLYASHGDIEKALIHRQRVKQLDPSNKTSLVIFDFILYCMAKAPPSSEVYNNLANNPSINSNRYYSENFKILTDLTLSGKCDHIDLNKLVGIFDAWLTNNTFTSSNTSIWKTFALTAKIHAYLKHYDQALAFSKQAVQYSKNNVVPLMMQAYYEITVGNFGDALMTIQTLQLINKQNGESMQVNKTIEYYLELIEQNQTESNAT